MSSLRIFIHPEDMVDRASFFALLKRVGFEVYREDDRGTMRLIWDTDSVKKHLSRNAGNRSFVRVREDILIEDVLSGLAEYWTNNDKESYVKDTYGISASTFRRRLDFFKEKYGSLQEAAKAGCIYFTDRDKRV